VINILAHRDATQRAYLQQEYKATYSEELSKRLVSELKGKLEVLIYLYNSLLYNAKSIIPTQRSIERFYKSRSSFE